MFLMDTFWPTVVPTSVFPRLSGVGVTWSSACFPRAVTDVASGTRRTGATGSSLSTATTPLTGPGTVALNCTSTRKIWPIVTVKGRAVRTVNIGAMALSCGVVIRTSETFTTRFERFHRRTAVVAWLPWTCGVGVQRLMSTGCESATTRPPSQYGVPPSGIWASPPTGTNVVAGPPSAVTAAALRR